MQSNSQDIVSNEGNMNPAHALVCYSQDSFCIICNKYDRFITLTIALNIPKAGTIQYALQCNMLLLEHDNEKKKNVEEIV